MVLSFPSDRVASHALTGSPARRDRWSANPALPPRLFGTDGIRGHVGELLTAPLALQVGFWAGSTLR